MSTKIVPSHIVGIGASAGGLTAIEEFFRAMPEDSGMAFVLVQHFSPDFKSLMDDLLARHTKMKIYNVENGLELEANSIYLNSFQQMVTIVDNQFYLQEQVSKHSVSPIDIFFESLASAAQSNAIGIVLSGTGADGSRGIQHIHEASGLVIAQSTDSAQFDGMPRAAINTGVCDYVIAPTEMSNILLEYAKNPDAVRGGIQLDIIWNEGEFAEIFAHLRRSYTLDFSKYKPTTVRRRIARRLKFHHIETIKEYVQLLQENSQELDALYHDLLIGVTEFFRDPATFSYFEREIVPALFRDTSPEGLRVWIAACVTGEETYSLAILLHEYAEKIQYPKKISIFATDVHRKSLEIASQGIYEKDRFQNVSEERLRRYFTSEGIERFKVISQLRKMVIFAPQNLISDPPFTKMDLVCCRNLLIYFSNETQERCIVSFNFSLRMGGTLFLGTSEGIGKFVEDFTPIHSNYKLFRKIRDTRLNLNMSDITGKLSAIGYEKQWISQNTITIDRQILHDYDEILKRYIPTGALLNDRYQVLHYFGDINQYLKPPVGRAENNFTQMVLENLNLPVSVALQRAANSKNKFILPNISLQKGTDRLQIDVSVDCLFDEKTNSTHYLITFSPIKTVNLPSLLGSDEKSFLESIETTQTLQTHITELEADLQNARENLQATVEELQTSNEELQATNEELLATNEELQSTNEELHSLNEELYTVNAEYEKKNSELVALNEDHAHLLESLVMGVVFLDQNLIIRKFNSASSAALKLLPQDIGRPIDHIAFRLTEQKETIKNLLEVLRTGATLEIEVVATDGRWLLQRVIPYLDDKKNISGVILTYTDVSKIKNEQEKLRESEQRFRELANSLPQLVWTCEADGPCDFLSQQWVDYTGIPEEKQLGFSWLEQVHPDDRESIISLWNKAVASNSDFLAEYRIRHKDGSYRWFDTRAIRLQDSNGKLIKWIGSSTDITERKKAEQDLKRWKDIFDNINWGIVVGNPDGKNLELMNPMFASMHGYSVEELTGLPIFNVFAPEGRSDLQEHICRTHEKGRHFWESLHIRKDGTIFPVAIDVVAVKDDTGKVLYRIVGVQDITTQKQAEENLRASEEKHRGLMESLDNVVVSIDYDGKIIYVNELAASLLGFSANELIGNYIYNVFPTEYAKSEMEIIHSVFKNDTPIVREAQNMMKDGLRWFRISYQPIHSNDGKVVQVLVNAMDIQEFKLIQKMLQNLNQSLEERVILATKEIQDLYNNAPVGYQSVDKEGKILYINETGLKWLGRTNEEVVEHFFTEFILPEQISQFQNMHIPTLLAGKPVSDLEYDLVHKDGTTFPIMLNATPVLDEEGNFIRSRSSLVDLTERRKIEQKLREINERLSDSIIQLEKALHVKDEFLASMSHELRTPLASILGFAEALLIKTYGELTAKQMNVIKNIFDSGNHLLSLINDILDLSKIEAGNLKIEPALYSLFEICDASLQLIKGMAYLKHQQVSSVIPDSSIMIKVDMRRMKQILVNLLSNAVKFTPDGGELGLIVDADELNQIIRLIVWDKGIGIKTENLSKLFKPFTQIDSRLSREYSGTGLGLSLTKSLVKMHQGKIEVESEFGKGSRFIVTIPWKNESAPVTSLILNNPYTKLCLYMEFITVDLS